MRQIVSLSAIALLAACSGGASDGSANDPNDDPAISEPLPGADGGPAGTRPSGQPQLVTVEGRIEEGVECPTVRTPGGEVWALSLGEADFGPGDYVSITGEVADASFCMQGEGTLLPQSIDAKNPPARDRDPARAGGLAVTIEYVTGSWVAKGVNADCDKPDFQITTNANGSAILESSVNGVPTDAMVRIRPNPAFIFDDPLPDTPIETRGPDGLAVLAPQSGEITIAGHAITGDGVVFVKCA